MYSVLLWAKAFVLSAAIASAAFSATAKTVEESAGNVDADKSLQTVGEARDRQSGDLLYREYYYCSGDELFCTVVYRDPLGSVITRKTLDYSASSISPQVAVVDVRHARESMLVRDPNDTVVVDAGFDNYVRSQWSALVAGDTVKFKFLVVDASKPYKMRATRNQQAQCDQGKLCLTVEIDSWLLGLVAPEIELVYSLDQRELLHFSGTSNIRSVADKAQQVDIAYRYEDLEPPN